MAKHEHKVKISKYTERELILLAQRQTGAKVESVEVYATLKPTEMTPSTGGKPENPRK